MPYLQVCGTAVFVIHIVFVITLSQRFCDKLILSEASLIDIPWTSIAALPVRVHWLKEVCSASLTLF